MLTVTSPETPFHRLQSALDPTEEQRARMLSTIRAKMTTAHSVRSVRSALEPEDGAQVRIWNRIRDHIAPVRARGFLDQVRAYLTPDQSSVHIGHGLLPAFAPVRVRVQPLKWVAAFALVLIAVRVSPLLFIAPQTIAQSSVLLRPTKGVVTISLDGLSQPLDHETEILKSATIHTYEGEATVILHDDGTIRLAGDTSVTLQDLTDRPQKGSGLATLMLASGTVWVQGLVPDHLRGLSVVTPDGVVTVHGGSVSITVQEGETTVEVWDRHARLEREGQAEVVLVAGERLVARNGVDLAVETMQEGAYDREWPKQNLTRDAVHQRAIAQEQRERIAAKAGILPTSRLYAVKRIAEEVDVLLTFDRESAVKKRVAQATTRLNEATTLIAEGQSGATVQLEEYQVAMLDIARGSGDTLSQQLVQDGVEENAAQLGAQLPDSDIYLVKRVVLDTTATLPDATINEADVEASVIGDAVDAIQIAAAEGDSDAVQLGLENLAPYIENLPADDDIDPTTKREVISRLTRVADSLQDESNVSASGAIAMRTVSRVIRTHVPAAPAPVPLTGEQIDAVVNGILDQMFVYSQYTGRTNQLHHEMKKLDAHPDELAILVALFEKLKEYEELNSREGSGDILITPDYRLSLLVRGHIQDVRQEQTTGEID